MSNVIRSDLFGTDLCNGLEWGVNLDEELWSGMSVLSFSNVNSS